MALLSSDSQSSQSFEMSSSSFADSTCSMESSTNAGGGGGSSGNGDQVTGTNPANHATSHQTSAHNNKKNSSSSSNSITNNATIKSSTRSSVSSVTSVNSSNNYSTTNSANLNHALAIVTNKLEREQRKNDEEATRKLTLLRQRKISAVLKADSLKKSLKSGSGSLDTKLQQVKELEDEMAAVDRELAILGEERQEKSRRLNLKRMQHVSTLQQLSLFDSLSTSDPDPSLQWNTSDELDCPSDNSFDRKVSPPFLDILTESRTRSGSDPSISLDGNNKKKLSEHRKSSQEATPSSPKSGRRNPFRMLSNAIDFRNRRKVQRPKSADQERGGGGICANPSGDDSPFISSTMDSGSYTVDSSSLLAPPPRFPISMTTSRHSLPNLDPNDMVEAQSINRVESSPYMTSPRKTKLPPPRHPLENRNSAPDIVVTGATGLTHFRHSSLNNPGTNSNRRHHHILEDRIHRAKARVQNGLYNISPSQSSSASSIYSTNSLSKPQKLSTRFQTATKINYKLAALSSFANVKRSRTFNISDVQETQSMTIGSSRTLPKPAKTKLIELGSGASSTTSSRKSSNTSSNSSQSCSGCSNCCCDNDKFEISQEALDVIADFEAFVAKFHNKSTSGSEKNFVKSIQQQQPQQQQQQPRKIKGINNNKTLERQKKIDTKSFEDN